MHGGDTERLRAAGPELSDATPYEEGLLESPSRIHKPAAELCQASACLGQQLSAGDPLRELPNSGVQNLGVPGQVLRRHAQGTPLVQADFQLNERFLQLFCVVPSAGQQLGRRGRHRQPPRGTLSSLSSMSSLSSQGCAPGRRALGPDRCQNRLLASSRQPCARRSGGYAASIRAPLILQAVAARILRARRGGGRGCCGYGSWATCLGVNARLRGALAEIAARPLKVAMITRAPGGTGGRAAVGRLEVLRCVCQRMCVCVCGVRAGKQNQKTAPCKRCGASAARTRNQKLWRCAPAARQPHPSISPLQLPTSLKHFFLTCKCLLPPARQLTQPVPVGACPPARATGAGSRGRPHKPQLDEGSREPWELTEHTEPAERAELSGRAIQNS